MDGVSLTSGQVISLTMDNGVEKWQLGCPAATDIPHFAYQDSADFDVVASGGVTGLSSLDRIELQTAFFNANPVTVAYAHMVRLKADGASGNVTTALTIDRQTLGYLSRFSGPNDIKGENSGVTPDGNGAVLVLTLMTNYESNGATA